MRALKRVEVVEGERAVECTPHTAGPPAVCVPPTSANIFCVPPTSSIQITLDTSFAEVTEATDETPDGVSVGFREALLPISATAGFPESPPASIPPPPRLPTAECFQHLILVVHGVNGSEHSLDQNLSLMRESFEQVRLLWFLNEGASFHIDLINWKSAVIGLQSSLFEKITPRHVSFESRMFINYSISDVAFYLTPSHCELIKSVVVRMLNERIAQLRADDARFTQSKISLVGYSLGSVILHDILAGPPQLSFSVENLFLWGSPLAAYLSVKDKDFQRGKFVLPGTQKIFNIYHPHDPVAFRIEPLFYHQDSEIADSELIPFWENGGLLSNKALERSLSRMKSSVVNRWNALVGSTTTPSEQLVPKRRLDFVLQESLAENLSHQYSMLHAHYSYWGSRDVALFMLSTMARGDVGDGAG